MHMKQKIVALALMPLALTAGQAMAQGTSKGATKDGGTPANANDITRAQTYLKHAASSDQYEIQSSQLALSKSQDAHVRHIAEMMIRDHQTTTATLTAAAAQAGLAPPTNTLLPDHRMMLDALNGQTGAEFDRKYLTQQRQAHDAALALHTSYRDQGDTPALRDAAKAAVPIIEQHRSELKAM